VAKTITMQIPLHGISTGKRTVKIKTDGFTGSECQTASAAFENAIGSVDQEELTDDYYRTEERQEFLQEGE